MTDFEGFYTVWAQANINYGGILFDAYQSNKGVFGVRDKILADKLTFMFKEFELGPMYFEEGINEINGGRKVEELDDCVKNLSGLAAGSVQSFVPTFIHMNAILCERDFGCNYNNLFQKGMKVSNVINELYLKLMGQSTLIPMLPPPRYTFIESIVDLYYQTDMLWLIDGLRMLPEVRATCIMELVEDRDADLEEIQRLSMCVFELSPQLVVEYLNIVNMLSNRPAYALNHDWGVLILSLLEADAGIHAEEIFYGAVEGTEDFTKCMIAQSKKVEPFLEKLRNILG